MLGVAEVFATANVPEGVYTGVTLVLSDPRLVFADAPGMVITDVALPEAGRLFVPVEFVVLTGGEGLLVLDLGGIRVFALETGGHSFEPDLQVVLDAAAVTANAVGRIDDVRPDRGVFRLESESMEVEVDFLTAVIFMPGDFEAPSGTAYDLVEDADVLALGTLGQDGTLMAQVIVVLALPEAEHGGGEYGDDEYGDGEHGDDEYGDDEHGDDEYGDGEHGDDDHGDGEYGDGEHGDDEHGDGDYGDGDYGDGDYGDGEEDFFRHMMMEIIEEIFEHAQEIDVNGDEMLSFEELHDMFPELSEEDFHWLDKNEDGVLTREDFEERFEERENHEFRVDEVMPSQGPVWGGNVVKLVGAFPVREAIASVETASRHYAVYFGEQRAEFDDSRDFVMTRTAMYVVAPPAMNLDAQVVLVDVVALDEDGEPMDASTPGEYKYVEEIDEGVRGVVDDLGLVVEGQDAFRLQTGHDRILVLYTDALIYLPWDEQDPTGAKEDLADGAVVLVHAMRNKHAALEARAIFILEYPDEAPHPEELAGYVGGLGDEHEGRAVFALWDGEDHVGVLYGDAVVYLPWDEHGPTGNIENLENGAMVVVAGVWHEDGVFVAHALYIVEFAHDEEENTSEPEPEVLHR